MTRRKNNRGRHTPPKTGQAKASTRPRTNTLPSAHRQDPQEVLRYLQNQAERIGVPELFATPDSVILQWVTDEQVQAVRAEWDAPASVPIDPDAEIAKGATRIFLLALAALDHHLPSNSTSHSTDQQRWLTDLCQRCGLNLLTIEHDDSLDDDYEANINLDDPDARRQFKQLLPLVENRIAMLNSEST